jgi:predicted glycosyltransferase
MCRVAYEFDIPIICTWDTIHADKVAKLTLSITNHVVVSMAVPVTRLRKFGVSHKSIRVFNGVDEVAWLYQAKKDYVVKNDRPLIVYRGLETSAAYVSSKLIDEGKIIASLRRFGRVLRLRRQSTKFVDALSLVGVADLFVGYGGTITREAVLQGTPAVVIETSAIEQHMNKFMAKKGFPVYFVNPNEQDISEFVDEKVDVKGQNTSDLVLKLDNPIDVIEEIVEGYS